MVEKKRVKYVPIVDDSDEGKQQVPQDLEPEEDGEPEPEQDKEANLVLEAAVEQGQGHRPA